MASQSDPTQAQAEPSRRPARDLIDAVIASMRNNLEPLKYSTLAPSRYVVYLHADEFARIEGIVPVLQEQTVRALAEELEKLNRRPGYRKYFDRACRPGAAGRKRRARVADRLPPRSRRGREVRRHPDPLGARAPRRPGRARRRVSARGGSRRSTSDSKTTKREETVSRTQTAPSAAHARLRYDGQRRRAHLRHGAGFRDDRTRRDRLPGRRADRRLRRRLPRARAHPARRPERRVLHRRSRARSARP